MALFNLDLCFRVAFLAALLPLTAGVCIDLGLGVGSGTIQDGHITSSSVQNASTPAKNGRLNYTSGSSWCAGTNDTNPYLQIDLQTLHIICAVSTQGNSRADQWVKNYTLQLSTNGTTWTDYKEGGKAKVLIGNDDRNSEVKHAIYGVLTRYLRFLPKVYQGGVCMRTEMFGVEKTSACDMRAIGLVDGGKIPDSSFTATSIFNSRYQAQYGRLNKTKAWAPKDENNTFDYLQVDLLYEHIICAVATQGNPKHDVTEWTTHYKIRFSLNDASFDTYKENSNDKVFPGNTDKDSIVINSLDEFASARFIRFVPTQYHGWKSLRVEVYGVLINKVPSHPPVSPLEVSTKEGGVCTDLNLGVGSGTIQDGHITSSSVQNASTPAKNGRLNYSSGSSWCAGTNDTNPYLQIDLQTLHIICAVSTQGNSQADQWVNNYTLQVSTNGTTWTDYREGGKAKVLMGNDDRNSAVKHAIYGVLTRYLRFLPKVYQGGVCMRIEVFGVEKMSACDMTTIGLADGGKIPDSSFTATSIFNSRYQAQYGRLNKNKAWAPKDKNNTNDYLQIDLLYEYIICAVATQGNPKYDVTEWTTHYKIRFSLNDATFETYKKNNNDKVFPGNTDKDSIVINSLDEFASARFIRFVPTQYHLWKSLRVEVYGVLLNKVPSHPHVFPQERVAVSTKEGGGCVEYYLGMENRTILDNEISASSEQNGGTPAKNGRLNYTLGSSWCARTSDTNPYLQIDLKTLHIICAVSTQGNSQADQWVKNYTLQLSTNGKTWEDYKEGGKIKILVGNDDRNSEVKHVVYGVLTRYLRFLPKTHQGGVCMRTEVFGVEKTSTCYMNPIGLADGGKIPDSSFTATSIYNSRYQAQYGRLNKNKAWGPKDKNNINDYLQIHLLYEYIICAVATQGNPQSEVPEWTTHYKIRLSPTDTTFDTYKENNEDKVFPGNKDEHRTVKNSLNNFASAKYIRFVPTQFHVWKILRVEVYGILLTKVPSQPPAAFKLTASSSTSIAAHWQLPPVFARHGRIQGFKLFYREISAGSFAFLNIASGSTLGRLVTGLHKYKKYEFQVLAYTSVGDGPKSSVEVERTMEDVPSLPPSDFNLTATNSSSISASWQLPPENSTNGIIRGFKLFYKEKGSSGPTCMFLISNPATRIQEVTGLTEYAEYEFQILAFTSVGDGPTITVVFNTKEAGKK